jgi:hypothetical protein
LVEEVEEVDQMSSEPGRKEVECTLDMERTQVEGVEHLE